MRKRGVTLVVLAVVAAGGAAALLLDEDGRRLPADFRRGVSLTGYSVHEYENEDSARALRGAAELGADWVTITPAWYQRDPASHDIRPHGNRTPSSVGIETSIRRAQTLGMNVTLKPHLNTRDGTYRGEIKPRDVARWFTEYRRLLRVYADMAERTGARELVVGTELEGVSGHSRQWRSLIRDARKRFGGRLTYAANYDEVFRIDFWDELDEIGVDAYFPLSKHPEPTVAELVEAWQKPLARLERLHERWDRDVLLTEVGYPSAESAVSTPYESGGRQDLDLQKRAVEAALTAFAGRPWIAGTTWWEWWTQQSQLEEDDTGFALNGKPAASVIQEWYEE